MFLTVAYQRCYDSILTLLYPQACAVCGDGVESSRAGIACEKCWEQTEFFSESLVVCWKCGLPSHALVPAGEPEQVRCHRCDTEAFDAARACGAYQGALRAVVLQLKREPHVPQRLLDQLIRTLNEPPLDDATLIVPVPLHSERERSRGFNQASIISRELSRRSALPLNNSSLVRVKHVETHRAGMDAKGRRDTVADAFRVRFPGLIAGERVLLVDDVFTTGATVSACAQVLKDAGAREVFVLTIARALH